MSGDHQTHPGEVDAALATQPRRISGEQLRRFEGYAAEMLTALGMDLSGPSTAETPHRFVQALLDARHLCVEMRGVRGMTPITRTTVWRGGCGKNPDLRAEFLVAGGLRR